MCLFFFKESFIFIAFREYRSCWYMQSVLKRLRQRTWVGCLKITNWGFFSEGYQDQVGKSVYSSSTPIKYFYCEKAISKVYFHITSQYLTTYCEGFDKALKHQQNDTKEPRHSFFCLIWIRMELVRVCRQMFLVVSREFKQII